MNVNVAYLRGCKKNGWKLLKQIPIQNFWQIYKAVVHANRINDNGIVKIECAFVENNNVVLQSRYYKGGDMRVWCRRKSMKSKVRAFSRIAHALELLHSQRLIHRDIKPENIVFETSEEDAQPAICDFDISKCEDDTHTTIGNFGTTLYLPPNSGEKSSSKRDIYALGVTMIDVLSCNGDYTKIPKRLLQQHSQYVSIDMDAIKAILKKDKESLSFQLKDLIISMLSVNPKDRPTAKDIVERITKVLSNLDMHECSICTCEYHIDKLYECTTANSPLFCCTICFPLYVLSECKKLNQARSNVPCFNHNDCKCKPYNHHDIARRVSIKEFREYEKVWQGLIEKDLQFEKDKEIRKLELELLQKSHEELVLLNHRREIEHMMNLCCPRCTRVFLDFDACLALTCSGNGGCNAAFCALCQKDCGEDAHAHVAICEYNTEKKMFMNKNKWLNIINDQRRTKLNKIWNGLDADSRKELAKDPTIMQIFLDLRLEIPGGKNFATELAKLRGMGFDNETEMLFALTETKGDIDKAINILV